MAHYYERDKVHPAPAGAMPHPAPRAYPLSSGSRPAARIDCDTCPIAGHGCGDCMVALLGPVRLRLDEPEQRAVEVLVDCGLVSAQEAHEAYAVPDLPDWIVDSWVTGSEAIDSGVIASGADESGHPPRHRRTGSLREMHGRATG
mgnify:CR=1 FL=1